jgi:hypothetical protein
MALVYFDSAETVSKHRYRCPGFNAAVASFLETGGAPPKRVTMLGRWHRMDGTGFAISELPPVTSTKALLGRATTETKTAFC